MKLGVVKLPEQQRRQRACVCPQLQTQVIHFDLAHRVPRDNGD